MQQAIDNTFRGIEVMTKWAEVAPTGGWPALASVLEGLDEHGVANLIQGLIGLAGELLIWRSVEVGPSPQNTLQEMARRLAAATHEDGDA